jgi:hypothetical protein
MTKELIKQMVKTFAGEFKFEVDREKHLVIVTTKAGTTQYTYDQVIDQAEELFK